MRKVTKGKHVSCEALCRLHSALCSTSLGQLRPESGLALSILPAIRALGVRAVDCRERKQGATVVVVDGGGL